MMFLAGAVGNYLWVLAWGGPAQLAYRVFAAFCNGLGRPNVLMGIAFGSMLAHGLLAWSLLKMADDGVWPAFSLAELCACSNVVVAWTEVLLATVYLVVKGDFRTAAAGRSSWRPHPADLVALLKLGLPMGISTFVEISSFTFMALFIARLGVPVVAEHRLVSNIIAVVYMFSLAIGVATLAQTGRALGAREGGRAREVIGQALALALSLAVPLAVGIVAGGAWLLQFFAGDPEVLGVANSLLGLVAVYQIFDAVQTVCGFALRAYRVTFVPMLIHSLAFWGVGLAGGYGLAFIGGWGIQGFWWAAVGSVALAALLLGGLLWKYQRIVSPLGGQVPFAGAPPSAN